MLVSKTGNISMLDAPFKEAKVPVLNTGDSPHKAAKRIQLFN